MLNKQQKNDIMGIANAYDENLLAGIVSAITDSGDMRDMLTEDDLEHAEQLGIDVDADDFDIMDEQHTWEFRQVFNELIELHDDIEEVCEHLATLI